MSETRQQSGITLETLEHSLCPVCCCCYAFPVDCQKRLNVIVLMDRGSFLHCQNEEREKY